MSKKRTKLPITVPKELQEILTTIDQAEVTLNILVSQLLASLGIVENETCSYTFKDVRGLLASRRHRILDQCKRPFRPEDYAELKSEPGKEYYPPNKSL